MIFAEITALLVKGADKAMTIKDGIKLAIGLEFGKVAYGMGCMAIMEAAYSLTKNKTFDNEILQTIQEHACKYKYKTERTKPKQTEKPIKNVIGFSVN